MGLTIKPPFEEIHDLAIATVVAFDWASYIEPDEGETEAVLPTVRPFRGVNPDPDEIPGIIGHIDGDDPFAGDVGGDGYGVADELRMDLAMSFKIYARLDTVLSGNDGSGYAQLGGYAVLVMKALKDAALDAGTPLGDAVLGVQEAGREPEPESTTDQGCLVQHVILTYRVDANDPTKLLRQGVDA